MVRFVLPLITLIFIAAFMRDDFAFSLVYLFLGTILLGSWWSRKSITQVDYKRQFNDHAFIGEKIKVNLELRNQGWLPVPWVRIHEGLPVALSGPDSFQRVTSLGPRAETRLEYTLEARKRGYYSVGPIYISTGDILGLGSSLRMEGGAEYLTVYPKIVPLTSVTIPSSSPQGTLRHTQPIFEDPTRVMGKRDYVAGDSLRRVDWKSTATTGRMQVKIFEPSIALETVIFLNLRAEDYHYRMRIDSTELAIVIAASISNWVVDKGQSVGLSVNGVDPLMSDGSPRFVPPRKGKGHLMRILETLARVEDYENLATLPQAIRSQRYHLSWGTTLIVITSQVEDDLLDELYQARRSGQNVVLVLAGHVVSFQEIRNRASFYH
jgi:uncharacterized protein (DUF58 family)